VVEGAINLMNKAGQQYEINIEGAKKPQDKTDKQAKFDKLCKRFSEIENCEGDSLGVSNRVKMLIKNMFNNKNTGWKRTEEMNKGGPKTKAEVETEVQDKLNKENSERRRDDDRRGNNGRYNDRGYDNRDNRDNRNNRDRRDNNRDGGKGYNNKGGEQRYQKKDQGDNKMEKQ